LYRQQADLFGPVHPADPARAAQLGIPPAAERVYAPLGAGNHVDHRLVRELALAQHGRARFGFMRNIRIAHPAARHCATRETTPRSKPGQPPSRVPGKAWVYPSARR
ncbi:MAG: hypothetical protein HC915_16505, partial [Anaerolineae bacterium]|nr:hypothetical protein [Anaerolineae bacterium]